MAHPKRVINFALFFMPFSILQPMVAEFHPPGQIGTSQDKFGQPFLLVQI